MKTTVLLLAICYCSVVNGQLYHRTKKNFGIYTGGSLGTTSSDRSKTLTSGSLGITHMLSPGIYPKIGWTYNKISEMEPRNNTSMKLSSQTLDASVLIDKRILKLVNGRRVEQSCHYLSIGVIGAPEFHYLLNRQSMDPTFSISAMLGVSFTHICTNRGKASFTKAKQLDVFVRRALLPAISATYNMPTSFPIEFGIQIRFVRHQVKSSVYS